MGKTGKTSFPWSARIGPKPGNSFLNGLFPASFFFILVFSIKVCRWLIRTVDLWCRRRPHYQLSHNHNHCSTPNHKLVSIIQLVERATNSCFQISGENSKMSSSFPPNEMESLLDYHLKGFCWVGDTIMLSSKMMLRVCTWCLKICHSQYPSMTFLSYIWIGIITLVTYLLCITFYIWLTYLCRPMLQQQITIITTSIKSINYYSNGIRIKL